MSPLYCLRKFIYTVKSTLSQLDPGFTGSETRGCVRVHLHSGQHALGRISPLDNKILV